MIHDFIFGVYPYLAGTIFILGNWIRYDREQYTWKADSSQLLSNKNMRMASNLFHVGILAVFAGHFVGLLTPHSWFQGVGIDDMTHQWIAIIAGLVFGGMCFIGALMLVVRRLTNERVKAVSRARDNFIIIWLLLTVTLGLLTTIVSISHANHGDASSMIALSEWVKSVATLSVNASLIQDVSFIYKLHIFFGMTVFLVFPFTRLVHVWSVPITYIGRSYQIVRRKRVRTN